LSAAATPSSARAGWPRLRQAYAWRRNVESLYRRPAGHQTPVDGLRALSMLWVMATHVCLALSVFVDYPSFRRLVETLPGAVSWIWHGEKALDTFFVISGYLIGGGLIAEHRRTGHLRLPRFYARRYLRLTPAYVVAVLMVWAVGVEPARKTSHLWANLLYVNNFLPCDQMFMDWTWSLAVEEQFYLVLPLFLVVLFFRTRHKLALMGALFVASFGVRAWVLSLHPHLTQTSFANHFFRDFPGFTCEYFDSVYDKLPTRFGPFVVGVALAWAHLHHGGRLRRFFARPFASEAALLAGAAACVTLLCVPIFRPDSESGPALSPAFIFAYAVLHRNVWAVGVGLGLLASLYPKGPLSRAGASILGARVWYPVAQLSYCTYLFHLGFVMVSYLAVAKLFHAGVDPRQALAAFSLPDLGLALAFTAAMSFAFGAIIYLLVERPFLNLRR